MRLNRPSQLSHSGRDCRHPVVTRALEAHHDDLKAHARGAGAVSLETGPPPNFQWSTAFLGEARRAGVSEHDLRSTLGSGLRRRRWDGCVLVLDWFLGVEIKLDPTERFGIAIRRVG